MKLIINRGDLAELRSIAPNCGYFGGSDWNSLVVTVEREVELVRLQTGSDQPEYLNLQQVVCISKGRDISQELQSTARCTRSSSLGDDSRPPSDLLRGNGVHTDREVTASWELSLTRPLYLDRLIIRNRSDLYGARSNGLHVIVGGQGYIWLAHDPYSLNQNGWLLRLLRNMPKHPEVNPAFRLDILTAAIHAVRGAEDAKAAKIWQYLQLIDQNETAESHKAANIELLAAVGARYHACGYQIETRDLHQFSALLCEKKDVVSYENAFNRSLRAFSNDVVTVSRHFITASKLMTHRSLYCSLIQEIHEIARACGSEVCLGYGTLLGCIRDNGFIPHDDDIDLIIRVPNSGAAAEIDGRQILFRRLEENGYQVEQFVGFEHHNLKKSDLCIELFPAYETAETVRLYMEGMRFREIPRSIMFPMKSARLYDAEVNMPANPEAFLAERYGAGWKRPDRFFEWRWELSGADPSAPEHGQDDDAPRGFDEARYLALHPDVARAVRDGKFKNGRSHFVKFGRREDRLTK